MPPNSSQSSVQSRSMSSTTCPLAESEWTLTDTSVKVIRRGRKPRPKVMNNDDDTDSITTSDFHSSSHSSSTLSFEQQQQSGSSSSSELDFLTKSPAGHQWRNKKHWKTNANATQRRYREYSGKLNSTSVQAMERELRRHEIRSSLLASLDDFDMPKL